MKKARSYWWVLLAVILFPVMSGGCGGGGDAVMSVTTTDRPAALVGHIPDLDFLPAFESRLTNKTRGSVADGTEIIILHDNHVDSLSDAHKAGLKKVYDSGGVIVLVEPTYEELVQLSGIVDHDLAAAVDKGPDHFCDMYAFNNDGHTYVVGHTHSDPQAAEEGEPSGEKAKKACYEDLMDDFVEWIDNNGPEPNPSSPSFGNDGTPRLEELIKAQTVTFNDPFTRSDMRRSTSFKNIYFIYALYDFDNDYDYYIFDLQTNINNGLMYEGKWSDGSHDYYGYWLYSYDTLNQLEGTVGGKYVALPPSICDIINPQPTTSIGSTSYTVGQSYNFSGTLGFSGMAGTGGVTGGASYSQSHSTNLSDISVALRVGQDVWGEYTGYYNAAWRLQVQNLPRFTDTGGFSRPQKLTPTPPISITTAVFYNTWIWRVKNPKGNGKNFNANCVYNPIYALNHCYPDGVNWVTEESKKRYDAPGRHIINLTPPPRERT